MMYIIPLGLHEETPHEASTYNWVTPIMSLIISPPLFSTTESLNILYYYHSLSSGIMLNVAKPWHPCMLG